MRTLAVFLAFITPAAAAPALHRIVLSSGGVGQFEFDADVTGADTLKLDVPLDQVDDVLKSLVVDDPAGPVQGIRLPGQQPLSESFRTLPFRQEAFASPEALLASLVGEQVRIVSIGARGAILSVSAFDLPAAPGQTSAIRHRLTIATDEGIVSTVLEDTPDIAFASETLRVQIANALAAIAAQRVQDRRTLAITLAPGEARHVRLGYVVRVPVWKTSYRLTLPQDVSKPARLEAFAVVENLSGRDWNGVSVTLTSGRPVLFHTPLYQPVFSSRPEAPVETAAGLVPGVDNDEMQAVSRAAAPMRMQTTQDASMPMNSFKVAPSTQAFAGRNARRLLNEPPASIAQSVAQVEFRLAAPVTASSGESLLLPIIDRAFPARRVALFQPSADPVHPLVAVQLTNDTDGALPPGLVTLFDTDEAGQTGYVGDARLPAIQPGEQRLASFALDLAVTVDAQHHATEHIAGGTIAHGLLVLQRHDREVTDYSVTTPRSAARIMVIEQPKTADDPLVQPTGEAVTTTPEAYRVTQAIPAHTTRTIELVTQRTTSDTLTLADMQQDSSVLYISNTDIAEPVRHAIQHAAELRAQADKVQQALAALNARIADITTDQARIRQNVFSVPANSTLHQRYLATMEKQETQMEDLRSQVAATQKQLDQANDALATYVAGLNL